MAGGLIEPTLPAVLSAIKCRAWTGCSCSARSSIDSAQLPVTMVTAYREEERPRRASELGAAKFLGSPVDFNLRSERLHQLSTATDGNNTTRSNDR